MPKACPYVLMKIWVVLLFGWWRFVGSVDKYWGEVSVLSIIFVNFVAWTLNYLSSWHDWFSPRRFLWWCGGWGEMKQRQEAVASGAVLV